MSNPHHRHTIISVLSVTLAGLLSGACVTTGTHDAKVAEFEAFKKAAADRDAEQEESRKSLEAELARRATERDEIQRQYDDAATLVGELRSRLEKLGQNLDQLSSEKGQLSAGLTEARQRLEELRRQKAAAEARAATFRGLVAKLRAMIDSGTIKVQIRNGRMVIAMANDILFDSGKTSVKDEGQAAIASIAGALASISDRRFVVAGHTDNVPIKTQRFPSNWELSTARAVEVARLLIQNGMRGEVLAAAGYGEFDPLGSNDTDEGRAQNRRIEIVLEPNLSDLPSLDDVAAPGEG